MSVLVTGVETGLGWAVSVVVTGVLWAATGLVWALPVLATGVVTVLVWTLPVLVAGVFSVGAGVRGGLGAAGRGLGWGFWRFWWWWVPCWGWCRKLRCRRWRRRMVRAVV